MSNDVSGFLSKGGIKKFKSGVKAAFARRAVKVAVATAVLASAFATTRLTAADGVAGNVQTAHAVTETGDTLCSYMARKTDGASFARLQKLVNNATKTETGREVIKALGDKGTVLHIGDTGRDCAGFFSADENAIVLSAACSDAELQSCLVHEGKHAMQNNNIVFANHAEYTFESNVMLSRVTEADAMTAQTKFCVEMAQRGDSAAYKAMAAGHAGMIAAYETAAAQYGANSDRTLKETMLSWDDDKSYVAMYDADFVEFHKSVAEQETGAGLLSAFTKTRDAGKVLAAVCQWKGRAYAGTDGTLLKTPRTAWLSAEDNAAMARTSRTISFKTKGLKTDKSADNFYALNGKTVSASTFKQASADNMRVAAYKMSQMRGR